MLGYTKQINQDSHCNTFLVHGHQITQDRMGMSDAIVPFLGMVSKLSIKKTGTALINLTFLCGMRVFSGQSVSLGDNVITNGHKKLKAFFMGFCLIRTCQVRPKMDFNVLSAFTT